mmetsp:Transcript_1037/g.1139  ORF Transcript_1037/g.1139 Transcript_1037/m.1139 type:complete len:517 (+) Transcript_1037:122-1672(+)
MTSCAVDNSPKPEDAASFITVSDPVQHSEGMNKFTSYRVDVANNNTAENPHNHNNNNNNNNNNTHDDMFRPPNCTAVLRRYSDFLWLYERLHKERAGAIVPPLPEKQAVSRFSQAFIEDRRVNLERFLRRIAVHPELYDANSLDTFLRADDLSFQTAKNAKGQVADAMVMSSSIAYPTNPVLSMPPRKKDGIKKWFAETKASMSGDLVRSPDDDLFEEIDRYIDGLEKQMKNVQQQASLLVRKDKELANGLFEFGMAFNILGQSEADALGEGLSKMGITADGLSTVSMEHADKEMTKFETPLKDYIKTIHGVKLALQKRHEKRLTYTTCLSEVAAKRANFARLRSMPGAEARAYGSEMSLKRGEAASEAAKEEFIIVSQRVLREVDRFKRENGESMKRTVLDYITLQIEYNKKMEQAWSDLLPQLEKVDADRFSAPGSLPTSIPGPTLTEGNGLDFSPAHQQGQPDQQQQQQPHLEQAPLDYRNQMKINDSQNMLNMGGIQYRNNGAEFPLDKGPM